MRRCRSSRYQVRGVGALKGPQPPFAFFHAGKYGLSAFASASVGARGEAPKGPRGLNPPSLCAARRDLWCIGLFHAKHEDLIKQCTGDTNGETHFAVRNGGIVGASGCSRHPAPFSHFAPCRLFGWLRETVNGRICLERGSAGMASAAVPKI